MSRRRQLVRIHLAAATGAVLLIAVLLVSSALVEVLGTAAQVRDLRHAIAAALPALVACLATAGLTGTRLTGRRTSEVLAGKQRRMRFIAAAGVLVLIPCALALWLLSPGSGLVTSLEVTELVAGATNLGLLALNFRDGRRLTAARRRSRRRASRDRARAGTLAA